MLVFSSFLSSHQIFFFNFAPSFSSSYVFFFLFHVCSRTGIPLLLKYEYISQSVLFVFRYPSRCDFFSLSLSYTLLLYVAMLLRSNTSEMLSHLLSRFFSIYFSANPVSFACVMCDTFCVRRDKHYCCAISWGNFSTAKTPVDDAQHRRKDEFASFFMYLQ